MIDIGKPLFLYSDFPTANSQRANRQKIVTLGSDANATKVTGAGGLVGVSAQWLRYGSVTKVKTALPLSVQQTGTILLGKEYAGITPCTGIIPLLDKLMRLSPRDMRIVEGVVQLIQAENGGK